ncbi:MAG TPA: DUF4386 family protein [Herpetosiphonaceae bacterium]|nr:DUF4386 family protein [Herpetosiphonaceae bacterium]
MTTSELTTGTEAGPTTTTAARSRAMLTLVGSVLGAVGYVLFLYLHAPWERGERVPYAEMAEHRETWLTTHYWLGPLLGLGFVVLGLAVMRLLKARRSVLASIAGVLLLIGGLGFAAGLAAEGILYYAATDPDALDPESGAALLAHLMETEMYFPVFGIGIAAVSLGCLVVATALVISKAVPLWVPILLAVGVVAMAGAPHSIAWWASSPLQIAAVAIAWYGLKTTRAA